MYVSETLLSSFLYKYLKHDNKQDFRCWTLIEDDHIVIAQPIVESSATKVPRERDDETIGNLLTAVSCDKSKSIKGLVTSIYCMWTSRRNHQIVLSVEPDANKEIRCEVVPQETYLQHHASAGNQLSTDFSHFQIFKMVSSFGL